MAANDYSMVGWGDGTFNPSGTTPVAGGAGAGGNSTDWLGGLLSNAGSMLSGFADVLDALKGNSQPDVTVVSGGAGAGAGGNGSKNMGLYIGIGAVVLVLLILVAILKK